MKSEKVYSALLHLYPAAFREEYGREVRAAFRREVACIEQLQQDNSTAKGRSSERRGHLDV